MRKVYVWSYLLPRRVLAQRHPRVPRVYVYTYKKEYLESIKEMCW